MNAAPARFGPGRRAAGFSLLEILIALLVLSLGLLGLAALQASTLQFNQGAHLRSQATALAYDISDRMRANRQAALGGDYAIDFADPAPACGAGGGDTVAERDIAAWRSALACTLPLGNGSIVVNAGVATISIRWDETRGEEAAQIFRMTTRL